MVIAPNETTLNEFKEKAEEKIEFEKHGRPEKLELKWNNISSEVIMTQKALIETMATKYLEGELQYKNSLPINPELYEESNDDSGDTKKYQALTGGLLYIPRMTRPEISIF